MYQKELVTSCAFYTWPTSCHYLSSQSASPVQGVIFKVTVIGQNGVGGLQHTIRRVVCISCTYCTLCIYTELHKSD